MNTSPSYFRARIAAINKLIVSLPPDRDEKNNDRVILRNGVIPVSQQKRFDELLDYEYKLTFALNEPLTFTEITTFNTWFAMHPEKVAGTQHITTSREFPISIKGSREDIINVIKGNPGDFAFQLQLQKRRAKAKLKIFNL